VSRREDEDHPESLSLDQPAAAAPFHRFRPSGMDIWRFFFSPRASCARALASTRQRLLR
jgi:hypothetical protein